MFAARCRGGRADDAHRQSASREEPGQVGQPGRLGIAGGLRQGGQCGHRGEDLFHDGGVIGRPVSEPGSQLPLRHGVGNRGQVADTCEVQPRRRRAEQVGVGDEHVGPSRDDRALGACDDEHAAVGDESVDTAGGLDRDVAATGALRGDLRDIGERARAHRDQQPRRGDFGNCPLDGLLVGTHGAGTELDHRAAEFLGEPVNHGSVGRAVGTAVADDHRSGHPRPRARVGDRAVQDRCADADVDVGQVVVARVAEAREDGVRFGNGCGHDGLAKADSTASNTAR